MRLLLFASLFLVSCGEQTELEQPTVDNGETVTVTKEIQVNVLPIQSMGGGATRSAANSTPEKGESIGITYTDAAMTRVQTGSDNMNPGESEIKNAYIVQFNGTDPNSTAAYVSGDIKSQLKSGSPITCSFAMAAGKKNRVYVIANRASAPTKGMKLSDFEAPVSLAPSASLPGTGLPMSSMQDIGVGDVVDVFQLQSLLAKLKFTCGTAGATMKLKGVPSGYSFYKVQPGDGTVRPKGVTYDNTTGTTLTSGTTYYVPENLSGRNEALLQHVTRCAYFAPVNSIFVEISADGTKYNIYQGDGSSSDFNFVGGYSYDINATIYGTDTYDLRVGEGIPVGTVMVDMNAELNGKTANCYIATSVNTWYMFNSTVMGNGATTPAHIKSSVGGDRDFPAITPSTLNPASAVVLWESVNTATAPAAGTIVNNNVYLLKDHILFRSGSIAGNAVIAAKDSGGTILWSWHIWRIAVLPAGRTLNAITASGFTAPTLSVMDRSLGALRATPNSILTVEQDYGLYYQWGRKDPFQTQGDVAIASGGVSITLADVVKNPTTFYTSSNDWTIRNDNLWGCPMTGTVTINSETFNTNAGSKSIYDPCPVGWKVMPSFAFANATKDNSPWDSTNKGRNFAQITLSSSTPFFLPASGNRDDSNGTLGSVGTDGGYWTSAPLAANPNGGSKLYFDGSSVDPPYYGSRAAGYTVRCVQE